MNEPATNINGAQWKQHCVDITHEFAKECAELENSNPSLNTRALEAIMVRLGTELWDVRFSRSEIHWAFQAALKRLASYCGQEERRGPY